MKQFLYLDTDIVNSIIAQAEKGLVMSTSNEKEVSDTEETTTSSTASAAGKIGVVLIDVNMVEKIGAHEICIALIVICRQTNVFVQVHGRYVFVGRAVFTIVLRHVLIRADRAGARC